MLAVSFFCSFALELGSGTASVGLFSSPSAYFTVTVFLTKPSMFGKGGSFVALVDADCVGFTYVYTHIRCARNVLVFYTVTFVLTLNKGKEMVAEETALFAKMRRWL